MAWGISPRSIITIPLGEYNADHYLTLLYHAFQNLGWRIGYFDRDGIIGYTSLSLQSYAEEVSVRIENNHAFIKSECVGYQFFFTDYFKNEKNIELLLGEISYVEYYLQHTLTETTQQLIDSIPDNQFIKLDNPPMGYKEKLRNFLAAFTPARLYQATPILVLVNIAIYIITKMAMIVLAIALLGKGNNSSGPHDGYDLYLLLGFNNRDKVLSGQVWRLLTSVFQHFSVLHIFFNMVALIYIGSLIEGKLGKWNYLLLYLCTGICASMTSVLWHDQLIGAGASGAIFGLFGILLALLSTGFYERNARRALLISTLIFVGINIVPLGKQVDHAAHLGGLASGYVLGLIAYYGLTHTRQGVITISSLTITIIFVSTGLLLAPRYEYKKLDKLTAETETVFTDMMRDIYGGDNSQLGPRRLSVIKIKVPVKLQKLQNIARQMDALNLPKKNKAVAGIKSKIIQKQCEVYNLVYKELLDTAKTQNYRPDINRATRDINQLRYELGQVERAANPEED